MPQDFSGQNLRRRSFKDEDLTGANFSGADVTKANFTNATLREANFTNATIKGANFSLSILKNANLSGAKAGLPVYWAIGLLILLFLLAVVSGFTSEYVIDALYRLSHLTGADIQDWGITIDTKFDGVKCEYVYMRLPTKENPDPLRKPDNNKEVFADGEYG